MTSKFTELAIDCADPGGLARFWCSVLDYEVHGGDDGIVTIGSPMVPEGKNHPGPVPPALTFAHVPEGKTPMRPFDGIPCARTNDGMERQAPPAVRTGSRGDPLSA